MKIQYKSNILSLLIVFTMILQLTACGFVQNAKDTIANTTKSATATISTWYNNIDLAKFKDGWDNIVGFIGSAYSSALSSDYVLSIGNAINDLKINMNSAYGSARGVAQEAGFAAEKWVAGTFNIDSAARESSYQASVVGSTELGSVDVSTNYGENASLKYYQTAKSSAQAQAKTLIQAYREYASASKNPVPFKDYMDQHGYNPEVQDELLASVYSGQTRIIPTDQLSEASSYLQGRITKLTAVDGDIASARTKSYQETLANLKDRLEAPDGTASKPATYEEMQAIAELSQNGEFKPENFGITVSQIIQPKYVIKQAVGTGLEVGVLKTVFKVGPDLVSILTEAAKNGIIDENDLKETGVEGAVALAEGFVEGSISRIVVTLCQEGALGATLKDASPNIIGAIVFLTIEAMIAGYALANGDISAEEYGCLIADKTLITALAIPTTALMLSILPGTKLFILLGCFAGGMIAGTGYTLAKETLLEFADGGGFEAILPVGVVSTLGTVKATISNLHLTDQLSNLKDYAVSTVDNGYISIKSVFN